MEERKLAFDRRSPVALLRGLAELLTDIPPALPEERASRHEEYIGIKRCLISNGFDVNALIRDAIIPHVAGAICGAVLTRLMLAEAPGEVGNDTVLNWVMTVFSDCDTLDVARERFKDPEEGPVMLGDLLDDSAIRIHHWLLSVSEEDLLDWLHPDIEGLKSESTAAVPIGSPSVLWIYDRFTETYLSSWRMNSLRYEWQYLGGKRVAPCSADCMAYRRIDRLELAAAIADRDADKGRGSTDLVVGKYQPYAVELLKKGDRESAVRLFSIACDLSPESADAHNNRGFCRLWDDPWTAIEDFERAIELGPSDIFVPLSNKMLALHMNHRNATALAIAEDAWTYDWARSRSAVMWDFKAAAPELIHTDSLLYLAELAMAIAAGSGDVGAETKWRARVSQRGEVVAGARDNKATGSGAC